MNNNAITVYIVIGIVVLAGGGASLYFFWLKPKWDKEKKDREKKEKEKKEAEAAAAAAAAAAATTENENENETQPGDIIETIVTSSGTGGTVRFNFSAWKRRRRSLGWNGSVDKIDDLIQKITEAKSKNAKKSVDGLPEKFFDKALTFLSTDLQKEAIYVKSFKFGEWKQSRRAALNKQNAKIDNLIEDIQEAKKKKKDRLTSQGLPYKYYDEAISFLKTLKKK